MPGSYFLYGFHLPDSGISNLEVRGDALAGGVCFTPEPQIWVRNRATTAYTSRITDAHFPLSVEDSHLLGQLETYLKGIHGSVFEGSSEIYSVPEFVGVRGCGIL